MKILVTVSTVFALLSLIINSYFLVMTAIYGRRVKSLKLNTVTTEVKNIYVFKVHKRYISLFCASLAILVCFIELPKLAMNNHFSDSVLFAWHIRFVVFFVINLVLMLTVFTGRRTPTVHSVLFVTLFHLYLFMVSTGVPMLFQQLMKFY